MFKPVPFESLALSPPPGPPTQPKLLRGEVAVTTTGVVVVDGIATSAITLDWSGKVVDTVGLGVVPSSIVAGPGDVLYGLHQGPKGTDLSMVAIALAGPSKGSVVASAEIPKVDYTELAAGAFGHGPNGIVHLVRHVGRLQSTDRRSQPTRPFVTERCSPRRSLPRDRRGSVAGRTAPP